jgi:hypothetical protein
MGISGAWQVRALQVGWECILGSSGVRSVIPLYGRAAGVSHGWSGLEGPRTIGDLLPRPGTERMSLTEILLC